VTGERKASIGRRSAKGTKGGCVGEAQKKRRHKLESSNNHLKGLKKHILKKQGKEDLEQEKKNATKGEKKRPAGPRVTL